MSLDYEPFQTRNRNLKPKPRELSVCRARGLSEHSLGAQPLGTGLHILIRFYPPSRQPRGKLMVSLVNSHANAIRTGWHLWEIDLRFALGLPPGWIPKCNLHSIPPDRPPSTLHATRMESSSSVPALQTQSRCPTWRYGPSRSYLTESVYKVALQKTISAQIRRLIISISNDK